MKAQRSSSEHSILSSGSCSSSKTKLPICSNDVLPYISGLGYVEKLVDGVWFNLYASGTSDYSSRMQGYTVMIDIQYVVVTLAMTVDMYNELFVDGFKRLADVSYIAGRFGFMFRNVDMRDDFAHDFVLAELVDATRNPETLLASGNSSIKRRLLKLIDGIYEHKIRKTLEGAE